jgi:proteasome accessory factor B
MGTQPSSGRARRAAQDRRRSEPGFRAESSKNYSRIHRLLRILTLIQSERGWDARRLADACRTTTRTIYRDLNMLDGAGVPYYFDDECNGYRIRGEFFMPPVELTLEESLALLCLADQLGTDHQIPFMKPAGRAAEKIRGRIPAALREALEAVSPNVEIRLARSMPPDGVTDVYEVVRAAIARRRALRCCYESPHGRVRADGSPSANRADSPAWLKAVHDDGCIDTSPPDQGQTDEVFLFKPYRLLFNQRAWYAIGHHSGRRELRCLKLNRFTRVGLTEVPYAIPENFSLRQYLGKAWRMIPGDRVYRVELIFDAQFAETIADTHWHETQEIEWQDDGSIRFRCEVSGLEEIVWWILSMGPHCLVRRPRKLAERVRRLARQTAARYARRCRASDE